MMKIVFSTLLFIITSSVLVAQSETLDEVVVESSDAAVLSESQYDEPLDPKEKARYLQDTFAEGQPFWLSDFIELDGDLQYFYYGITHPNDTLSSYANALGGNIRLKSKTFYDFGVTVQYSGSNAIGKTKNYKPLVLFDNAGNSENLNTLSQLNLFYTKRYRGKNIVNFKVGSQLIETPVMNLDTTKIVPYSYEAMTFQYSLEGELNVQAGAVSAIKSNVSGAYSNESPSGKITNGIWFAGMTYELQKYHHFMSYFYLAPQLYNTYYGKYAYNHPVRGNVLYSMGVQFIKTFQAGSSMNAVKEGYEGGQDVTLLSPMLGVEVYDFELSAAYSQNFGVSGIRRGYGGLTQLYTSSMISNGRGNYKPKAFSIKPAYNFPGNFLGFQNVMLIYTRVLHDMEEGQDQLSYYAHIKMNFDIDTSLYLRYENLEYTKTGLIKRYLRLQLKYRF